MKSNLPAPRSLAGRLLVAEPDLLDPNFSRSVVYLVEHSPEGAMGVVLNRPMGRLFGEITRDPAAVALLGEVPVFHGGPVKAGVVLLGMLHSTRAVNRMKITLSSGLDELRRFVAKRRGVIRAFAGYAGWSPGQLESELESGTWKVMPANKYLLDDRLVAGMWPFLHADDWSWASLYDHLPRTIGLN
jgi:putative transcriptional regulator